MAALDGDTELIYFLSSERIHLRYEVDLLREIRAQQISATCVVVGLRSCEAEVLSLYEPYLAADGSSADANRPPVDVIFGQLLGCTHQFRLVSVRTPQVPRA
jgi:tagatose-6-phosphate ketose/aldose isomerase